MTFLRKRKGVSGIISGVFLVAVAVMIFNVLAWQFFQYDTYHRMTLERDQREWERFNERIMISDYLNFGYPNYLRLRVRNIGGVAAHIVTAYLNDTTANVPRTLVLADYITPNCSAWINSGMERWVNTTISLITDHVYDLKVATERGNIGIYLNLMGGYEGEMPKGTQPVPFTFSFLSEDFQYNTLSDPNAPGWQKAWVFPKPSVNIYFKIKLKNAAGYAVQVESRCHLNVVTTETKSGQGQAFESKAFSKAVNAPIDVLDQASIWLVFGPIDKNSWWSVTTQYYVFLAVYYHRLNPTGPTMGMTVSILAIEVTS